MLFYLESVKIMGILSVLENILKSVSQWWSFPLQFVPYIYFYVLHNLTFSVRYIQLFERKGFFMNRNTITGDYINVNLRQLGATSIKEFNSIMHIAEFNLGDGLIISYVFNITRHNKYFLQRVEPYSMIHGKFASSQEIIEFITEDLKRFENAKNSHNFNTFLLISHLGHHVTENIEQLFLNYNVDAHKLEEIQDNLESSLKDILKLFDSSEKISLSASADPTEDIK